MSYTERFSEMHSPLVMVPPATYTSAAEAITAYVSLANYHRAALVIHLGNVTATGTVLIRLLQATNTSGGSAKGIPTTATQDKITSALANADDNGVVVIELRTEELDVDNGFDCVAIGYDVDTDSVPFSAILYGIETRFAPVASTAYNEIVA
jgi:hypothetical protein